MEPLIHDGNLCLFEFYGTDSAGSKEGKIVLAKDIHEEDSARNYESTCAVLKLDEILKSAVLISEVPAKRNNNQKAYEKMLLMKALEKIKLTVGLQRSTHEYVQYCVTAPTEK